MLLRVVSSIIAIIVFSGFQQTKYLPFSQGSERIDKVYRISVLSLFSPQSINLTFPEKVFVKIYNNYIPIQKNKNITIKKHNNLLSLTIENKNYFSDDISFYTTNKNIYYNKFTISIKNKIERQYHGGLEIQNDNQKLKIIVLQNIEDYTLSVLSSEASATESEFLKAFSIIIRTYAIFNQNRHKNENFDFCDNTHCMLFYGETNKRNIFESAVKSSNGKYLRYNDQPIDVYFSGSCGGKTKTPSEVWGNSNSIYPYKSINCNYCYNHKHRNWSWKATNKQIQNLFPNCKKITAFSIIDNTYTNFCEITTTDNSIRLSVDEFRLLVGRNYGWNKIYSNNYNVIVTDNNIIFNGHGFGHSVGFCQAGALEMSKLGFNFYDIIKYYYPLIHRW
jgi:stage II sporulation protein D